MTEIYDWCLGDWYKETDFLVGATDILPKLFKQNKTRFFYNQSKQSWSKKSCTVFGAWKALADLFDEPLGLSEFKEVDTESYNRGRKPDSWWYVWMAVDLWREWRNSNKKLVSKYWKVASYYIEMKDDPSVTKIIANDYNIVTWFNGNAKYTLDTADGTLDWTDFWPSTYWHCINVVQENERPAVQDNYWEKSWYYLKNLPSKIKCWHNWGYLFTKVKENNYEVVKELNEMKTKILINIQNNSDLWHLTKSEFHRVKLHEDNEMLRERLDYINEQLAKYM